MQQRRASTKFRDERSLRGHAKDELISAMHKAVRAADRGLLDYVFGDALTFLWGDGDRAVPVMRNFVHRLTITTLEDACTSPAAALVVERARENLETMLDAPALPPAPGGGLVYPRSPDTLRLAQSLSAAAAALCEAPKSRICSHARCAARLYAGGQPQGPVMAALRENCPWALDLFGRLHQTTFAQAYAEGDADAAYVLFFPHWEALGTRERRKLIADLSEPAPARIRALLDRWYTGIQKAPESFMCAFVMMAWNFGAMTDTAAPVEEDGASVVARWESMPPRELPAHIYDMHTKKGRLAGKGKLEFILEGSLVKGDPICERHARFEKFYYSVRTAEELSAAPVGRPQAPERAGRGPVPAADPLESRAFEFLFRAQLTPGDNKSDVYMARAGDGTLLVVKGPYDRDTTPRSAATASEWLRANGLPYHGCALMNLYPDRWPEGVPLGRRNFIPCAKLSPFLVMEYIGDSLPATRTHSSTRWPPTEVLESDASWKVIEMWEGAAEPVKAWYVLALFSKFVLGVCDWADRNFVLYRGRIYAIDNDVAEHKWPSFEAELRGRKHTYIKDWVAGNAAALHGVVASWTAPCVPGGAGRLAELLGRLMDGGIPA